MLSQHHHIKATRQVKLVKRVDNVARSILHNNTHTSNHKKHPLYMSKPNRVKRVCRLTKQNRSDRAEDLWPARERLLVSDVPKSARRVRVTSVVWV